MQAAQRDTFRAPEGTRQLPHGREETLSMDCETEFIAAAGDGDGTSSPGGHDARVVLTRLWR